MPRDESGDPVVPFEEPEVFDPVEEAIADVAAGKAVIVTDDLDRENEGDFVLAASRVTPEAVNLLITEGRGLICVPATDHHLRRLGIGSMVPENREKQRTDFTVSVDAAEGISTGISAYDRAETIRLLADPSTRPDELVQPGHVFPLRARAGGVLQRAGHTEAAVDLAVLAGLHPCGVICEILNPDGTMARLPQLVPLKQRLGLKMISIASLIEYRHRREKLVERIARQPLTSDYGAFELHVFRNTLDGRQHLALILGELSAKPTLVRVHGGNVLRDVFRAQGGGGGDLSQAMEQIQREGRGVILYMQREDNGVTVADPGPDGRLETRAAGMNFRDYGAGAQILVELGLRQIRLLSSTNRHVVGLEGYGLEIVEQVPLGHPNAS